MEIIFSNPFRIIGLFANSTERELQKNQAKIRAYSKIGKKTTFDTDFPFMPTIARDEDILNLSLSKLQQSQDKVHYGLFWFLNLSPVDKTAIGYLKKGNVEKAKEIWLKLTEGKKVNEKNFSAFNNLGTLLLTKTTTTELQQGFYLKIKLISSKVFQEFAYTVADKTFSLNENQQSERFIVEIIKQLEFSERLDKNGIINLVNNLDSNIKNIVREKLSEAAIANIETLIESTKKKREEEESNALDYGFELFERTEKDLKLLNSLFEKDDIKYRFIADNLAKEILQCGIDYFNENAEKLTWEEGQKTLFLFETAEEIGISNPTKKRIENNIEKLNKWLDEYDQIKFSHLCWFCEKNKADEKCQFTITMYSIISRSFYKVRYRKLEVPVSRCCECKKHHTEADNRAFKISAIIYVILLITILLFTGFSWANVSLFALVLILPLTYIYKIKKDAILTKEYKIKFDSLKGVKNYPLIKELKKQGWTFSKPSA